MLAAVSGACPFPCRCLWRLMAVFPCPRGERISARRVAPRPERGSQGGDSQAVGGRGVAAMRVLPLRPMKGDTIAHAVRAWAGENSLRRRHGWDRRSGQFHH